MEKVSAIVAIYKSEKFLPKLIDSIINQTWQNLEILLVDDGSPDNSGAICDDYASRDDRIRVIHKKNGGACEARNVGLAEATGEYILIIDGDDWLELDYVAYLMNLIHQTGAEMAMTDKIFTTRDREQTKKMLLKYGHRKMLSAELSIPSFRLDLGTRFIKHRFSKNIT